MTNLFLLIVFEYLSLVPHELGHVLAARLMGMNVFRINFGQGRRIAHVYRRDVLIEFRALPVTGFVSASTLDPTGYRWRRLIFILGGPLANLSLCFVAIELAGGCSHISVADWNDHLSPWLMLALANAIFAFGNLIPRRTKLLGGLSDGGQILTLLFRRLPAIAERRLTYFLAKAQTSADAGDYQRLKDLVSKWSAELPEAKVHQLQSLAQGGAAEPIAAREEMLERLQRCPEPGIDRAIMLNALAWDSLILASSESLEDADRFSAEAYSLAPWSAGIQNTRGWALAECGYFEEGIPLLRQSLKGAIFNHDRASVLCTLALAEVRRGKYQKARKYERQGRRLDARCGLLPRVVKELEESQQVA